MKKIMTATALLLASVSFANAEGVLQLYNWGDYTNPELLTKFEKETGIKVTVTDYDSNDTALAKVEAGGSGFDLVVPSANYVPIWIEKGLVQELDLSQAWPITPISRRNGWMSATIRAASSPFRGSGARPAWPSTRPPIRATSTPAAIFLDPPPELVGKVNVTPEMNDVLALTTMYLGGQPCSEDPSPDEAGPRQADGGQAEVAVDGLWHDRKDVEQ